MTDSNQTDGEVLNYDDSLKMPVIGYNNNNNSIVFNNPIETNLGIIASSEDTPVTFNSAIINGVLSVGSDFTEFIPMPLPSDPDNLNIPIINSMGTIQTTDLMIAKNGVIKLYSNTDGTHIYGDLIVDGNISGNISGNIDNITKDMVGLGNVDNTSDLSKPISTATQAALDLKANMAGLTKDMVELSNVDNTSDLLKPISDATQVALNLKAPLLNPIFNGIVTACWCGLRAYGTGGVIRSYGQVNVTTSNIEVTGTGTYKITMPSAHPLGANYGVVGSCISGFHCLFVTINSSTQFTVNTCNMSGVLVNGQFTVMTIP